MSAASTHQKTTSRVHLAIVIVVLFLTLVFAAELWSQLERIHRTAAAGVFVGYGISREMPWWDWLQSNRAWASFFKREAAVATGGVVAWFLAPRLAKFDQTSLHQGWRSVSSTLKKPTVALGYVLGALLVLLLIASVVAYQLSPDARALNIAQESATKFFTAPLDDEETAAWIVTAAGKVDPDNRRLVCYCTRDTEKGFWWGIDLRTRTSVFLNPPKEGKDLDAAREQLRNGP
jgi:hypothetical protein